MSKEIKSDLSNLFVENYFQNFSNQLDMKCSLKVQVSNRQCLHFIRSIWDEDIFEYTEVVSMQSFHDVHSTHPGSWPS